MRLDGAQIEQDVHTRRSNYLANLKRTNFDCALLQYPICQIKGFSKITKESCHRDVSEATKKLFDNG